MASVTSRLDRDPWIEDLNATSSLSYLSKLLSTLFPGGASLNAAGPISFLIVAGLSKRLLSQMPGEHIRNEFGSNWCIRKEVSSLFIQQRRRAIYLVAIGSAMLGSPYGTTHRSFWSSKSHCSGSIIPMSEVEQLRSCWSKLDPHMLPLSSLGVVTDALLSHDTLPGSSLLTGLVILVIECSARQFQRTGEVSGFALVEEKRVTEASSIHIDFGFSAPYFDLPFLRYGIPNKSLTPRKYKDFTPGESFTLPPLDYTIECIALDFCPSPRFLFALSLVVTPDPKHPFSIHREIQSSKSIKRPSWTKIQRDQSCWELESGDPRKRDDPKARMKLEPLLDQERKFHTPSLDLGERELLRGGDTHSFCLDQTLPKVGCRWGSRLSWSPPTCGRGGELILRCQGARRRPQVEATDVLVIPVDSLLPVRACCHAGKSEAFSRKVARGQKMRIQSRRSRRMVEESMDSLGINSRWLDIRVTTDREEERSMTELLATSCKGKDKTTFLIEEEESDARNSHVFLGLTNPAKSVFLNWKSKNKSIHFFRGAEQSKNNTDQMIVLEWLFLTIAPCDAAEPWQLGSQDAATPMMQGIIDLHHDIFFFLILILVFVSRILVRALWHFQKDKNPIPQRIVHGTTIEIL
ncbi:cytochrome c oxidase subunit II [Tanacetum coccineum]|uniref:Cytochrome c oxidase subunit II n=1 Tax=Tanacetum coccineum TaxID=301880 RepID=A0ABQ5HA90_9ASTR